ncbi:MAG: O-antigen ligase family protein [Waterburya sp.]
MKELILNPPIFIAIIFGMIGSFVIAFYLTENKRIASVFQQLVDYGFLFIVSGVTLFPFTHLDLASLGSPEKSLFSGLLLLAVYAAVLILLRVRFEQILINIIILFQQKYLGLYSGLIIFSALWSSTSWLSFKAAISLTFISIFAVYFAKKCNWQELFKLLRWNQTFIALFSAFLAIFVPSKGQMAKGWAGAIGHPIDLGNMMALTSCLWLLNAIHNRKYRRRSLFFSALSIVIMQLANSAGAFLVFLSLVVIVLIPPVFRKLNFLQANFLFICIVSTFGMLSIWLVGNLSGTFSLLNKDLSLTGRVPLWNLLIESRVVERLWLGYGYSGFWQPWEGVDNPAAIVIRLIGDWAVHAHNGFLDIILNVGLVGFLLFIFSLFYNIRQAMKLIFSNRSPQAVLPLMILTFILVSNLSQTSIIFPSYSWFLFVLVSVRLHLDNRWKKKQIRDLTLASTAPTTISPSSVLKT